MIPKSYENIAEGSKQQVVPLMLVTMKMGASISDATCNLVLSAKFS
ncbi:hypothetical protein [Clostridium diolis]|nr:hypothetical protein [Clostridium diolis]